MLYGYDNSIQYIALSSFVCDRANHAVFLVLSKPGNPCGVWVFSCNDHGDAVGQPPYPHMDGSYMHYLTDAPREILPVDGEHSLTSAGFAPGSTFELRKYQTAPSRF